MNQCTRCKNFIFGRKLCKSCAASAPTAKEKPND